MVTVQSEDEDGLPVKVSSRSGACLARMNERIGSLYKLMADGRFGPGEDGFEAEGVADSYSSMHIARADSVASGCVRRVTWLTRACQQ